MVKSKVQLKFWSEIRRKKRPTNKTIQKKGKKYQRRERNRDRTEGGNNKSGLPVSLHPTLFLCSPSQHAQSQIPNP